MYRTSDLALAATLKCLKYELVDIESSENEKKYIFVFGEDRTMEKFIKKFWNHEIEVDALEYFNILKDLKNQIYGKRS